MTNQNQIQPIFIMPEGTQRTTGRTAQRANIMAARAVAETVRTTLGPKGMDKMIVNSVGDITVTNDGVTILEEMQIEHPAAKMIVEVARTQEADVGDGTTTAVVIAGELLRKAEELLDRNIHPTVIARGYRLAGDKAKEILENISEPIDISEDAVLRKIAITAITGKGAEVAKERLSDICVRAVKKVAEVREDKFFYDSAHVKLEKRSGGSVEETELIDGIVLDKEAVHPNMPRVVKNAKIVLLDASIEIKNTEIDAKIQITDPRQMQAFIDQEQSMLRSMVEKISSSGASVLFCQKGIDDLAQHFLAKKGIYAARRVKKSDLDSLSKATGAVIVTSIDDISAKDLGFAGLVEERKLGDDELTFVTGCKNPKSVTILVKGSTEHVVSEVVRAMTDALGDIAASLKVGRIVAGAGAPEIEVSRGLRKFADSLSGREQLAVNAFADAIEVIPRTLAENAGLDPIDIVTELKSAHDKKQKWAGVDVFTGKVIDAWRNGILEPLKIKTQAISSASEVAQMILRIDDVIAGSSGTSTPSGAHSPPQGMGDMGGMY